MSEKIKINAEEFAYHVLGSYTPAKGESNERTAKNELLLYLESYYLIQEFNGLEANNFKMFSPDEKSRILQAIAQSSQNI